MLECLSSPRPSQPLNTNKDIKNYLAEACDAGRESRKGDKGEINQNQ